MSRCSCPHSPLGCLKCQAKTISPVLDDLQDDRWTQEDDVAMRRRGSGPLVTHATLQFMQRQIDQSRDELKETIKKLLKFQAENMKLRQDLLEVVAEIRALKRKRGKK